MAEHGAKSQSMLVEHEMDRSKPFSRRKVAKEYKALKFDTEIELEFATPDQMAHAWDYNMDVDPEDMVDFPTSAAVKSHKEQQVIQERLDRANKKRRPLTAAERREARFGLIDKSKRVNPRSVPNKVKTKVVSKETITSEDDRNGERLFYIKDLKSLI